jgi:hypothetical protein
MDVHMLDRDLLLTLATVAMERVKQDCVGAGELVGLGEVLARPSNDCSPIIARR